MSVTFSEDTFLGGRLRLRQPEHGLRAGLDAIVLAAALPVPLDRPTRLLDAGAGSGIVGLAAATRVPELKVSLLEKQPQLIELARQSIALNALDDRVEVIQADLTAPLSQLEPSGVSADGFDHAAANPPYQTSGTGRIPAESLKSDAIDMPARGLELWIRFLTAVVRPGGTVTLVHRADAVAQLLELMQRRFGAIIVFPLYPQEGKPAHRILVQGTKGSRAPLSLMPGLTVHETDGRFRPAIETILRDGAGLDLNSGCIT